MRALRLAPLVALVSLAACSSILGIEDLHEGPDPGSAGTGANQSGSSNQGGAKSPGGAGSDGGTSGNATSGNGGSPSTSGTGGNGAAGDGMIGGSGAGGSPNDDPTVRGKIIDYWGHAVPNVPLDVGGTLTNSDARGEFEVNDVASEYDVSMMVQFPRGGGNEVYGWVYQGLTRRDPTLQVYAGLASRSGTIVVTPENETLTGSRTVSVSLGGNDGSTALSDVNAISVSTSASWRGPASTNMTAYGLLWGYDTVTELPTGYYGYDFVLAALSETTQADISLDLADETIATGNLQGTVIEGTGGDRANGVFLRFNTGASIQLVDDTPGPNSFSYLVPTIANSSLTVSASEGIYFGPYGLVHKGGLAPGGGAVELTVPRPATPLLPAPGTTGVNATTPFSFQAGAGNDGAFVVSMISDGYYEGIFVVTAKKQFTIPEIAQGAYTFRTSDLIFWQVETHGDHASVDAMAGPTGFLDAFSSSGDFPTGPRQGNGKYTLSQGRGFTTAAN